MTMEKAFEYGSASDSEKILMKRIKEAVEKAHEEGLIRLVEITNRIDTMGEFNVVTVQFVVSEGPEDDDG